VRGTVAKLSKRDAAKMEQPIGPALLERVSWDDLRVFVVVARTLSFRKAATALRTSSSTIVRRMERLEESFGFRLFDRLPDGVGLTAEGRSVYESAQQMERASLSLRAHLDQDPTARGMVRCSVTEGLGTLWIVPHLTQFNRTHPSTIVDLRCSMEVADVLRMEADVAIQLDKPDRPDVKAVRLGRMHIYPFASRKYADTYGLPATIEDVVKHRIIHQQGPQVQENAVQRLLKMPSIEGLVTLRTNTSVAHYYAVELGMGIGGLGTYLVALGTDLIPVDIGVRHHVDIWMTYHPDVRSIGRVATYIDWLRTLFDPKRYPWFGDEFIHPREIAGAVAPGPAAALLPILRRGGVAKAG
jgi:DNA-binding transcriptional LysR family regulator